MAIGTATRQELLQMCVVNISIYYKVLVEYEKSPDQAIWGAWYELELIDLGLG